MNRITLVYDNPYRIYAINDGVVGIYDLKLGTTVIPLINKELRKLIWNVAALMEEKGIEI